MRKSIYIIWVIVFALTACRDTEVKPLFDKSADERAAEAIAALKADLVAPANGYKLKYTPSDAGGSFYVFLDFNENNSVRIRTDLAAEDTRYFDDTITYRIDSSLGLELIMESYCFFGFLYELDQATFGGEYEFNYSSKTSDGALVFISKTDPIEPKTRLVFEPASVGDLDAHLATTVAKNLNTMADELKVYTQPYKITYDNKDLILYLSMDDVRRTLSVGSAAKKSNTASTTVIGFDTPYMLDGDSIVFSTALSSTYLGVAVNLKSIKLSTLTASSINVCASPIATHVYKGTTSLSEGVTFEPTLNDAAGPTFVTAATFYDAPLGNVLLNGINAYQQLQTDLTGMTDFQIYYNYNGITAMGFRLENENADPTFALKSFTMTRTGNKLTFNFASSITLYGNGSPDADLNKVEQYIDELTDGNNTYVFKLADLVYEFHNPCTGWSYIAIGYNN